MFNYAPAKRPIYFRDEWVSLLSTRENMCFWCQCIALDIFYARVLDLYAFWANDVFFVKIAKTCHTW